MAIIIIIIIIFSQETFKEFSKSSPCVLSRSLIQVSQNVSHFILWSHLLVNETEVLDENY